LIRQFETSPPIMADRHKVLQILVNLLRNAQQALLEANKPEKAIALMIAPVAGNGHIRFKVCDDALGISDENLKRIFQHGFTTKKDGHGFGLHGSANAAQEMGGSLVVERRYAGRWTAFTLELPVSHPDAPEARIHFSI